MGNNYYNLLILELFNIKCDDNCLVINSCNNNLLTYLSARCNNIYTFVDNDNSSFYNSKKNKMESLDMCISSINKILLLDPSKYDKIKFDKYSASEIEILIAYNNYSIIQNIFTNKKIKSKYTFNNAIKINKWLVSHKFKITNKYYVYPNLDEPIRIIPSDISNKNYTPIISGSKKSIKNRIFNKLRFYAQIIIYSKLKLFNLSPSFVVVAKSKNGEN